jgi:hypothetical protein
MSLPLRPSGAPDAELVRLLSEMRAGNAHPCSQYFDVLAFYDARSTIVHEGTLGLSADQENGATWFIAARLLHRVLTWFAGHPDDDLTELDAQIAAMNLAAAQAGSNIEGVTRDRMKSRIQVQTPPPAPMMQPWRRSSPT